MFLQTNLNITNSFPKPYVERFCYAFNGMEKDDEVKGNGNSYNTEFRNYDSRLGRWMSIDPVDEPDESPYVSMANNPIYFVDYNGEWPWPILLKGYTHTTKTLTTTYGKLVQYMGKMIHHNAIDMPAANKTPIRAAARGMVVFAGEMEGYGYAIIIKHKDGYYSLYGHMAEEDILINTTDKKIVSNGQIIARVGNKGASYGKNGGYHLHLQFTHETKVGGKTIYEPVDPTKIYDLDELLYGETKTYGTYQLGEVTITAQREGPEYVQPKEINLNLGQNNEIPQMIQNTNMQNNVMNNIMNNINNSINRSTINNNSGSSREAHHSTRFL